MPGSPGPATIPPAAAPAAEPAAAVADLAALHRLLAATADAAAARTVRAMPNAAPPLPRAGRRRAVQADEHCRASARAAAAPPPAPATTAGPTAAPAGTGSAGVPASWSGFGGLLTGAGERAPADALTLATIVATADHRSDRVDLSGLWALPAATAEARSDLLIRALDDKGRLQLPLTAQTARKLPAEWDGALVTVFLPDSPDAPRPAHATDALRLDARGRLTLSAGVRRQAGIPDGADVLATVDAERRTVTLAAASRLYDAVTALLDGLRRPAAPAADGDAVPAGDAAATVPAPTPGAGAGATASAPEGRLRIVR